MSYWQYGLSPQATFTISNGEIIRRSENKRHPEWEKMQHIGLQGGCLGPHADSFIVGCAGILKIDTFST